MTIRIILGNKNITKKIVLKILHISILFLFLYLFLFIGRVVAWVNSIFFLKSKQHRFSKKKTEINGLQPDF